MTCRIAVLISGFGSNLQALIDACDSAQLPGEIVCVLSNQQQAYGLTRARHAQLPAEWLDPADFADREAYDQGLIARLERYQPDIVLLAGYMRILSAAFIQRFRGRLLNIHPSLLPKYPGLNTHQRVIDAGDQEHGCSVHFVTETLDGGPVILQAKVPVFDEDSAQTLAERVQSQEHRLYPLVANWLASGRLQLQDGKAWLDGQHLPQQGYASDDDAEPEPHPETD